MFEQLDDPDDFDADESFFAGTSRRFSVRRRRQAATRTVGGLLCLALIAPAFFGAYRSQHVDNVGQPDVPVSDESTVESSEVDETTSPDSLPVETFPAADTAAKNFLIVGLDNNACSDPGSQYSGGLGPRTGERADTIMVVRLDATTQTASVLSFPRDLWVDVPGHGTSRINSAYAKDDPQLLIDTLSTEFRVPVDHFIQFDFCAFKKLIDGIGGVTVPMPYAVRDQSTGLDIAHSGCISLSGDDALAYVRSRHFEYQDSASGAWHEDPSSDLGRIARQQDLLRRVLASASKAGVLTPGSVSAFYSAFRDDLVVDTGLTIAKMIEFVGTISTISPADIRGYEIEATGKIIAGSDVLIWHKDSPNMNAILDIFRGAAPSSPTSAPPTSDAPQPNMPTVAIVPDPATQC
jgi:LCP family protein required for cell wall assembly